MNHPTERFLLALAVIPVMILGASCGDRDPAGLEMARATIDPLVFDDAYSEDVYFQPFFETHYLAVTVDSVFAYDGFAPDGARSLKINIPAQGSALGAYSGGVFTSAGSRDLVDFNALTFYARTDVDTATLDVAGFGNDNSGNSLYEAGRARPSGTPVGLNREWTFVVVPIPAPSKLIAERGLLTFAESAEQPDGYNIWLDEIRFARLDDIVPALSFVGSTATRYFVGSRVSLADGWTRFQTDGGLIQVGHSSRYFDLASSDPSVAIPVKNGELEIVGEGTTEITGSLDGFAAGGRVVINGHRPPSIAADSPALPPTAVISMFSDSYADVPVETWRADWEGVTTRLEDFVVAGQLTKKYSDLNYVGVDFTNSLINASDMTHFHLDVYAPGGSSFNLKLVSFPAGGDDGLETALTFSTGTVPAFNAGSWSALEIPLADFDIPEGWDWSHIGQLVFDPSFDCPLVLVDNVYWHK